MTQTIFYLMRHGQCEGGNVLRGRSDQPLSELGFAQMQLACATKLPETIDALVSSPLSRCQVFAEYYANKQQLPCSVEAGLMEIDFGRWDGEALDTLFAEHSEALNAYWQDPWRAPLPGSEPLDVFEQRVETCIEQVLHRHSGKTLLLVTHGGVIRHLMGLALGIRGEVGFYTQLSLDYGSVVKLSHLVDNDGKGYWRLHWG